MKFVRTGPGGHKLQDILKKQKVSHATISRLKRFIEQIDKRLSSQGVYYRVHTHSRGLTYFPTDEVNVFAPFFVAFSCAFVDLLKCVCLRVEVVGVVDDTCFDGLWYDGTFLYEFALM